jgi:acyl-CoA thioesterase FadM
LDQTYGPPLDLDPKADLYGGLLFQGPLFQRMGSIYELDSDHTVFASEACEASAMADQAFAPGQGGRLILGDPFFRDVLLQAGQLTIPQEICLPVRIERIERFRSAGPAHGRRIVVAPWKVRQGREYLAEIFATDEKGQVVERLTGYRLRILEEHPENPTAEELARPRTRTRAPERTTSVERSNCCVPRSEEGGIDPWRHSVNVAHDGPQGQPVQELRFVVSFQEASGLSRHVPASRYLAWMGKMRELITSSNVPELIPMIATGEWGLVTNWAEVRVLGEATANDVVQMRFWGTKPAVGSEIEFFCDFWKLLPDGTKERLAFAEQKATWVRLVGHGQVVPEPLPPALAEFITRMGPRSNVARPEPSKGVVSLPALPESLARLELGRPLYQAPAGPAAGRVLWTETFATTLEEANLVGNIYFANYFAWQGRLRDRFLHAVAPEYLKGVGTHGELIGLRSRVDYLREAMPFDSIEVVLRLRSATECGAVLGFEYYRVQPDGSRQKLSVGVQEVAWVRRQADGTPVAAPFPEVIRHALLEDAPGKPANGDWRVVPGEANGRARPTLAYQPGPQARAG